MPTATITSYFNFSTAVAVNNLTSILPKTKPIHMSPLADLDLPLIHHPRFSTAMAHPLPASITQFGTSLPTYCHVVKTMHIVKFNNFYNFLF